MELGEVVIAVDTSGSVGPTELAVFRNEIEAVLGAFDCSATIVYHDCKVLKTVEWNSMDGPSL
jgi:predicted metal-dependent peptidase